MLETTAQQLSEVTPITIAIALRISIWAGMCPAARSTNAGSTAANKITAFGLVTPTISPSRAARTRVAAVAGGGSVPANVPPRPIDVLVPPERHFPLSVVIGHGVFALTTVTLVVMTTLGVGGS